MHNITKEFVDDLYNPQSSGISILKQFLDMNKLKEINQFILNNQNQFQEKREKNIDNNQKVALLYRGVFDMNSLEDTVFDDIVNVYKSIRSQINQLSTIPFTQGDSLEIKLINYPVSPLGVGNHKDLSSNVNLIVFFNLSGSTDIKTYSNKAGENPVSHLITPGDISLMRGPRLNESVNVRPYHGVEQVYEERTVLVIREINEVLEKETNKDNWRGF